jgi:dTMP kinase
MSSRAGTLIAFEGLDGAGKSTQIELLAERERHNDREVVLVREPGGTRMGELQRALVKADVDSLVDVLEGCGADRDALSAALGTSHAPLVQLPENSTSLTRLFMFNAARSQLYIDVVLPALDRGALVVTDRSYWSNVAYQGSAGIEEQTIIDTCLLATGGRSPDLTIYCRLDQAARVARMRARGLADDVIERTSNFDAILAVFDRLAAEHESIVTVDAGQSVEAVSAEIENLVRTRLDEDDLVRMGFARDA